LITNDLKRSYVKLTYTYEFAKPIPKEVEYVLF